jgi:xanthine dehydrogenase iron-sulfur cluster and FAD-binding subunit A
VAVLGQAARHLGTPMSDHRASADYRRAMITGLLERFYSETTRSEEARE